MMNSVRFSSLFSYLGAAAVSLTALACGGNAYAGESTGETSAALTRNHGPGHGIDAMLARFDTNKDGKLQVSELPEKLRERLGSADADKDGVVSADELKAHRV